MLVQKRHPRHHQDLDIIIARIHDDLEEDTEFVERQWLEELYVVWMATLALERGEDLPGSLMEDWERENTLHTFRMYECGAQATGKMEFLEWL